MKIERQTLIKVTVPTHEDTPEATFTVDDYSNGQELRKAIEKWGETYGAKIDP